MKLNKTLIIITFLFFSGCVTAHDAIRIEKEVAPPCLSQHNIYVLSHGWHTGLALNANDLNLKLKDLKVRFPDALYYEIGWGDAGFYQAEEITTGLALKALFKSSGTVIHIVGFSTNPEYFFPESECVRISLNKEGYEGLLNFIKSSFVMNEQGNIVSLKKGIYGDSQFYEAEGKYHAFNTCNTWTAKALKAAGLSISPRLKLTAGSVMDSLNECLKTKK